MKKRLKAMFFSKAAIAFFTVLSAISALLFYSVRYGFVFVDDVLYTGFSLGLFVFTAIGAACLLAILNRKAQGKYFICEGATNTVAFLCEVLAVITFLYSIITIIVDKGMSLSTAYALFKSALPVWAFITGVAFFAFAFPLIKNKVVSRIVRCVTALILIAAGVVSVFPIQPFTFSSSPVVFDNGSEYSIVFSTSSDSTGYVAYESNGEWIRVYDVNDGRKKKDRIHTVTLQKDELSGKEYRVGATRIIDELSYGGRTGKTIESDGIFFHDDFADDVNILTVSDWHTKNKKALSVSESLGSYQAVILLGDCAPGLMSREDICDYILDFAAELTDGAMPVLYVRGNHETRGRAASYLADYLGYDSFYYTTSIGSYDFVVLDSCEDKEDTHPEYGGMADYTAYRSKMTDWLCSLESTGRNTIALCHSPDLCLEPELAARSFDKLESMGSSLLASGHLHRVALDESKSFPVFIDGGVDSAGSGSFAGAMMSLTSDGIRLKCQDNNGSVLLEKSISWNK